MGKQVEIKKVKEHALLLYFQMYKHAWDAEGGSVQAKFKELQEYVQQYMPMIVEMREVHWVDRHQNTLYQELQELMDTLGKISHPNALKEMKSYYDTATKKMTDADITRLKRFVKLLGDAERVVPHINVTPAPKTNHVSIRVKDGHVLLFSPLYVFDLSAARFLYKQGGHSLEELYHQAKAEKNNIVQELLLIYGNACDLRKAVH